ncbi:MAG: FixH family protein [Rhodomicrobium sp.]
METRLKGKHVLFILLSFFGVVFAVNGYFAFSAIHTLPGEERGATYEAGLRYNTTIAEGRAQRALRWSQNTQFLSNSRLALTFAQADGSPVSGLSIEGWLGRPASNRSDRKLTFAEIAPGRYEAAFEAIARGAWDLDFTAKKHRPGADPAIYSVKEQRLWKRIWIGPAR